jgi:hypothetical protein
VFKNELAYFQIGKLKNVKFSYDPEKVRRSQTRPFFSTSPDEAPTLRRQRHRRGHRQPHLRLNRDSPQPDLDSSPLPLAPNPYNPPESAPPANPEPEAPEERPAEAAPVTVYTQAPEPAPTEPPSQAAAASSNSIKIYKFRFHLYNAPFYS